MLKQIIAWGLGILVFAGVVAPSVQTAINNDVNSIQTFKETSIVEDAADIDNDKLDVNFGDIKTGNEDIDTALKALIDGKSSINFDTSSIQKEIEDDDMVKILFDKLAKVLNEAFDDMTKDTGIRTEHIDASKLGDADYQEHLVNSYSDTIGQMMNAIGSTDIG